MAAYLETTGVVLLAVFGILIGRAFSRLPKPYWAIGYITPFLLAGMVFLARRVGALQEVEPFSWLMAGRREFVALAISYTMLMTTALARLPLRRQRVLVNIFMSIAVIYFSILPFALPAILQGRLAALETIINPNGVCIQGTAYTCGPAAAVTLLGSLGIRAEEGQIAVAARSTPVTGTPSDLLCDALTDLYAENGISCESLQFDSIKELREAGPTMAVIEYSFMVDHYVAVLNITDDKIVLGDPLRGKRILTHDEFSKIWRQEGIVLKRRAGVEPSVVIAP